MNLKKHVKRAAVLAAAIAIQACGGSEPGTAQQSGAASGAAPAGQTADDRSKDAPKVTYECPEDTMTLVDICLGMPPDQVKAVLLQRDPNMPIRERLSTITYSDGAQELRTEPYINRIRAETDGDEYFEFHFTAPPGEGKLVHMQRMMGSEANLPAIGSLMDALVENYGEPAFRFRGELGSALVGTLRWDFPADAVMCSEPPQSSSGLLLDMQGIGVSFSNFEVMLDRARQRGTDDPADCARWLQVHLQTFNETDPVRSVDMVLTDFATAAAEARETLAWLEQKEAQARADRLENAEVPDL